MKFALSAIVLSGLLLVGCQPPQPVTKVTEVSLTTDELRDRIDSELDFGRDQRRLNTKDHAAWQIIHGALAYERDFLIDANGRTVRAIEYAMNGGEMKGWSLQRGDLLDADTQRYGVRSVLELGSKVGQGHPDQWLGYLQDCDIKPEEKILIDGQTYTVNDWVEQIERDVPRNPNQEFSWTLMTLTKYRPTTHKWIASDGK
ncbi:MAG TPA: ADP-ribosylation factor-directed GTPase activating protein isoform b, partial [Pirellulaceae bacterium]|nr:ADP-ribosylation factor-directed GTPase activating protein isoform b [Pirellulaceae bacterium]